MKLLEQYQAACEVRRLAPRTIQTYCRWVEEFIRFHHDRTRHWIHPQAMGEREVEAFLTHVAVNRRLAASTQNQALGAILFLYRHVLRQPLGSLAAVRASKPKRLPTVLSKDEVRRLIAALWAVTPSIVSRRISEIGFNRGSAMVSELTKSVVECAKRVYERQRAAFEAEHPGRYVAIEPQSGEFFLGDTFDEAVRAARAAHPSQLSHTIRIGHEAAFHIGLMAR